MFSARSLWILSFGMVVGWFGMVCSRAAAPAAKPPNIILILVDDLGWADLGCYGNRFHETPNLDQLAQEGVRFTSAYSACTVCSPTRASLLTGKYPARLHLTDWIAGHPRPHAKLSVPAWTQSLPGNERTLAEALREVGYTSANIGKWHLGKADSYPEQHGFDRNVGGYERGQPPSYHSPYRIPTLTEDAPGKFLTDREADEAIRFIEENRTRSFFLYLPHYAVHTPLAGKPEVIAKYQAKLGAGGDRVQNPVYAALLESVDRAVGSIRQTLARLGLQDQTILLFTSDNGGLVLGGKKAPTSNLPLRSGKGSPYEGGVRVPLIAFWPKVTPAGAICDAPVITPDLYPTVLGLAGARVAKGQIIDGTDLRPLLQRPSRPSLRAENRAIFWHYPHYHPGGSTPYSAIREGDYKLIETFEQGKAELYDLRLDLGETKNLLESHPKRAARLLRKLQQWRVQTGAQMPSANPDYDPARDTF
ncbi:MAG: sulfatase [Verrucomicrobiales bacterium]|nr:sulfatase [Verrucomicrobiales bacterium]